MKDWLLSVLRKLQKVSINTINENGRRIASTLSIILCFDFLIPHHNIKLVDVPTEDIVNMISMLALHPDMEQRKCYDFDAVNKMIPSIYCKKKVFEAILSFCNQLIQQPLSRPAWLYAVPLIHFYEGLSQPFMKPQLDPSKILWPEKSSLGLNSWKQKTYHGPMR